VADVSLYGAGWRQGSVLRASLPLNRVVFADGRMVRQEDDHEVWIIASQDCDLDIASASSNEPTIELRPVFADEPPPSWGIRSRKLRLDDTRYVLSEAPRTMVSPAVVSSQEVQREPGISPGRAIAFKTWLGLRYDRPAVPEDLVNLGRKISEEVVRDRNPVVQDGIHDVLMQFDSSAEPPRYSLIAVVTEDANLDEVRAWLAEVALAIPPDLGTGDHFEAVARSNATLEMIENSYAADATQLTWGAQEPRGAM
jgi:hypothetical protein